MVTGGSAGVGREAVRRLAARGWDVAVLARGAAGVQAAADDVGTQGRRGLAVECDVADRAAVEAAADRVEDQLGPIDAWINAAFVGALRFSWDMTEAEFRRITEVTYLGQVHGTQAALARMRPRDRGVIVNVGSALAFRGIPLQSAYCGAKHAVQGYTEAVRTELKATGSKVRICTVQLPGLNTPQFDWNDNAFPGRHPQPVAPVFQPDLAGRAIAFLAEHPRRNLWVGVSTAYTVLGNRLAPWFLDWYLGKTGVTGQLTDTPGPRHGANVERPRDQHADRGSHGMFDAKAHDTDPWSWTSMHRLPVAAALAAAATLVGSAVRRR